MRVLSATFEPTKYTKNGTYFLVIEVIPSFQSPFSWTNNFSNAGKNILPPPSILAAALFLSYRGRIGGEMFFLILSIPANVATTFVPLFRNYI